MPSHPVLSCPEAKAFEAALLRDESAEWAAMKQAGAAIAKAIIDDFQEIGGFLPEARILVLVGKGHNGGDALLAAGELVRRFPAAKTDVLLAFGEKDLRPLAAKAWKQLLGMALQPRVLHADGRTMGLETPATSQWTEQSYDLCLDGIFGMQFRLPLDEKVAELIARANTHPRIRFRAAVDLPSGLGEQNAGTVFRADFTYATGIVKEPVLRPQNAPFVGRVRYLDLGFFDSDGRSPLAGDCRSEIPTMSLETHATSPASRLLQRGKQPSESPASGLLQGQSAARILLPSILIPLARLRRSQTDKRTYGHLFLVGGSLSYPGAIVLAARAALRSGVGLVTAFVPEALVADYSARHSEIMWVGMPVNSSGAMTPAGLEKIRDRISRATALAIGPGFSADPDALALARQLADFSPVPLLFDADAIRPEVVEKALNKAFIVTPHAGELQRIAPLLLDGETPKAPFGIIVAKGPCTRVIGLPHHPPATIHNPTTFYSLHGGPVLARGGSGDILAGLIGGLLAQQPADPLLAACRGVVWHGQSADLLARARGQVAVEISEILEHLGRALNPPPCPTPNP